MSLQQVQTGQVLPVVLENDCINFSIQQKWWKISLPGVMTRGAVCAGEISASKNIFLHNFDQYFENLYSPHIFPCPFESVDRCTPTMESRMERAREETCKYLNFYFNTSQPGPSAVRQKIHENSIKIWSTPCNSKDLRVMGPKMVINISDSLLGSFLKINKFQKLFLQLMIPWA